VLDVAKAYPYHHTPFTRDQLKSAMEEMLRTRKLSSASARKRKMEERQAKIRESKQRSMQRRDTKEFRFGYGYCSDEEELSDSDGNHNTFSPIVEGELDRPTANASPSTGGARTPSPPFAGEMQAWPDIDTRVANVEDSTGECSTKLDIPLEGGNHLDVPTTPAKPIFQPTLTSRADFSFDFYSPDFTLNESLDPDLDLDLLETDIPELDPDTPIEIATPVLYSQPRSRPYMISISVKNSAPSITSQNSSTQPSTSSLQAAYSPPRSNKRPSITSSHCTSSSITSRKSILQNPVASPRSLTLPATYRKRISNASIMSGYPACEATPVFAPPPMPPLDSESCTNSSQESLLESIEDHKTSKKPGMINSLRKSGLNNIISYVKDAKPPSREGVQPRPTTAVSNRETEKETCGRAYSPSAQNRDDHPAPLRPRTATAGCARSWGENCVTALPTPPEPPMLSVTKALTFEVPRKKSFSTLRSRSTSLGKALRSASSSVAPTTSTPLYPSKLNISTSSSEGYLRSQSRNASMDLTSFPIPPSPLTHSGPKNYARLLPSLERSGFAW
jgi:hypothetical protein